MSKFCAALLSCLSVHIEIDVERQRRKTIMTCLLQSNYIKQDIKIIYI